MNTSRLKNSFLKSGQQKNKKTLLKSHIVFLGFILAISTGIMSFTVQSEDGLLQKRKDKKSKDASPYVFQTNIEGKGSMLEVSFTKGKNHNYPLIAIWIEDINGQYVQTLYVSQSIAYGTFDHGTTSKGKWMPGEILRPAALPYWGHKRGVKSPEGYFLPTKDNPVPDAYTGASPQGSFILRTKTDAPLAYPFKVMLEINQSWDWNPYWTNNKFPDDPEYKTSSQPAVVYQAIIDNKDGKKAFEMMPVGRSHYSGKDGKLYDDLSTLTTALKIADKITVTIMD